MGRYPVDVLVPADYDRIPSHVPLFFLTTVLVLFLQEKSSRLWYNLCMKLGYDLTIEQTQKLVMTPELIQAIQILQYNSQELDTYVQEQILSNPVLEQAAPKELKEADRHESEGFDWKEFIRNSRYDDISYRGDYGSENDSEGGATAYERIVHNDVTLPEHLMFQFQFAAGSNACRRVGKYIIESLDENGYMTSTVEEIAAATGVQEKKVNEALDIIHGFDPAGVGARDLGECLLIQLESRNQLTPQLELMIKEHLEDVAHNRLGIVAKDMSLSAGEVQEMVDIVRTLEPKPGRQFAIGNDTKYVVPDVFIEEIDGEYVVVLNDNSTPHLTVGSYYKDLLHNAETDNQLAAYLSERVNSAMWLIRSIEQRRQTIYNVVSAIVKYQKDFFDYGSKHLKVLTLKDIAEEVGMHESTVSRSINGKYLQCSRGVYELKHFFPAGVSAENGEGISSNSIKEFIRELIDNENPAKPLSDQKIVSLLEEKGFAISRRTVAKYRDEMGVLSSSKRRRY